MMHRVDTTSLHPVALHGAFMPRRYVVKDLGLLTDSTLDCRAQVTHVNQMVSRHI